MPRGFKVDERATLLIFRRPYRRGASFISQPKFIEGEDPEAVPHAILEGKDKGQARAEIFRRNREENRGVNRCWNCAIGVEEEAREGSVYRGEWDHIRNKAGERCDCPENGRVACRNCHRERHVQTQFSKKGGRSNG